jgi:hypothetical protein
MNAAQPLPDNLAKPLLTYSVHGLPVREVLMLKSMVRLLIHRTPHHWVYSAQSSQLRVMAENIPAAQAAMHAHAAQHLLTLGTLTTANHQRPGYLCLPLRASELERELNRLGVVINTTLQARQAAAMEVELPGHIEPVRMLRWPPTHLLQAPGRLKLATLMTGQSLTVEALQLRSGQPLVACKNFLDDLQSGHLLQTEKPAFAATQPASALPVSRPAPTPITPDLFARIRLRFGLQNPGESTLARHA